MKLIFFLVAFFLVSIRVYFSWSGKDKEKRGESVSDMVIKSDNFYEEINYSGKFQLTEDETGFKSISPGGYFKYRKNDVRVKAESNLQGEIEYKIYDGSNNLSLDGEGEKLLAEAIREMIYQGFDASARIERIYRKGGSRALMKEIDSMRIDPVKILYLDRLFAVDSSLSEDLPFILLKIGTLGSDQDKARFLNKISPARLNDPKTAGAWFAVVGDMGSDMDRSAVLQHMISEDSVTEVNAEKILSLSARLGSDMDKRALYQKMIEKGLITGVLFDSLLNHMSAIGSDMDKIALYKNLIEEKNISTLQWIRILDNTSQLESDMDKTNLLTEIAKSMPRTEATKTAYLKSAHSISNDNDYGRAVRAIE